MKPRYIINGTALSEPGTMGGNSKIALELMRGLVAAGEEVHLLVPTNKLATVTGTLGENSGVAVHEFAPFTGGDFRHFFAGFKHYTGEIRRLLTELKAGADDIFYSASDFHVDTLVAYALKREFGFRWIAVQFLFVPFIFENLLKGYRFPALKYLLVWIYSNVLFRIARLRADAFVITNHSDLVHFPKAFRAKVFPFYGGVNVDQIPADLKPKTRDVVFCSRLHPQKGIDGFLDVWARIQAQCPHARLTVIGNGAPEYEAFLKAKAQRLGLADSIDWLGYVNNEAKYEIYASARVMVHPTVFDNNGMVAAEALCSGLPVVMYDLPALRELYTIGCAKVPFGDQSAFANEVVRLLTDPDHRAQIAPNATSVATLRSRWDWSARVSEFCQWLASTGI